MTDNRFDPSDPGPRGRCWARRSTGRCGKITTGIVIAGAIVGLAVYARPGPPRFDAFAFGDQIVRVDGRTGTIIACEGQQTCQLVLRKGQRLERIKRTRRRLARPRPRPRLRLCRQLQPRKNRRRRLEREAGGGEPGVAAGVGERGEVALVRPARPSGRAASPPSRG